MTRPSALGLCLCASFLAAAPARAQHVLTAANLNAAGETAAASANYASFANVGDVIGLSSASDHTLCAGGAYAVFGACAAASAAAPPSYPTDFAGAAVDTTTLRWSWLDHAPLELGYRVMSGVVDLSGDLAANATTWLQSGLTPNTLYGPYFARVFNSSGSADSGTASRWTLAAPPAGSMATSYSATAATIAWTLNGNPLSTLAEVRRSIDGAAFGVIFSSAATSMRDGGLFGCTSYYYKVRNHNGESIASAFGATVLVRTANTVPGAPTSLTAEAAAGGRVNLSWVGSPTEGITAYKLYFDAGTGVFDFGVPLAVFTSTESSFTTGVLASSAAYSFSLRALHRCGVEETTGVFASAASTAAVASVRASIKNPDAGKKISGNRVTVMAELIAGTPAQTSQVSFQYRASTSVPWIDLPTANVNHPNPDLQAPYFTHWNVDLLTAGSYQLRALAYDGSGNPDPAPGAITVVVDSASPDIEEDEVAGRIRKRQVVSNAVVNTIATGGKDADDPIAKIVLPPNAVDAAAVTVTVESNPAVATAPPSGFAAVGSSLRIDLSNGQHNLSNGQTACITLSYPSNVGDPSMLAIHSLNEGTGIWSRDFATMVNTTSRTVTGCTPHFSIFAVFQGVAAAASQLDGVRLYPNPYKPNSGDAEAGKPFRLGDESSGVIFDQLPAAVVIEIYSLSGRRVARLDMTASVGKIRWDARNSDGRDAASGGYFAVFSSPGLKSTVRKFIIIR